MNRTGRLIVITGLDGSGTTSIGKALAESDPNGIFFSTPHGIHSQARELFDGELRKNSPAAHFHFYLSAVISASDEIRKKLDSLNVYCARYLIDTIVSHRVAGLDVKIEYDLGYTTIVEPDLTLFIEINEEIRQNRITKRGKSKLDKTLDDECFRKKFLNEFKLFKNHFHIINNSGSRESCLSSALKLIKKL